MKTWREIPRAGTGPARAKRALIAGYPGECDEEMMGTDPEFVIENVLTDLRHLCDHLGLNYPKIHAEASYQYYTEKRHEQHSENAG